MAAKPAVIKLRTADEQKMFEWTRNLIAVRKQQDALKYGDTTDLYYDNDIYIFQRTPPPSCLTDSRKTVLAFNFSDQPKTVSFPTTSLGEISKTIPNCSNFLNQKMTFEGDHVRFQIGGKSLGICQIL